MTTLFLTLKPHLERGGYHTERVDAYLGDELLCTSRSGWHEPARALMARGYPPDTLLHVQHHDHPFDPTIVPKPICELAEWTIEESDKGGLKRRRWRPYNGPGSVAVASPAAEDDAGATAVPEAA